MLRSRLSPSDWDHLATILKKAGTTLLRIYPEGDWEETSPSSEVNYEVLPDFFKNTPLKKVEAGELRLSEETFELFEISP